jgi:hypothetical protein
LVRKTTNFDKTDFILSSQITGLLTPWRNKSAKKFSGMLRNN